jgi:hypothetical protein
LRIPLAWIGVALSLAAGPRAASAHCDGLDGPVVTAARAALDAGRIDGALLWIEPADEAEVRRAFERALAVRSLGPQAMEVADLHFFETLVRLHRAAEGAPYTGLAPSGRDLGPAIPAADRAVESGALEPLEHLLVEAVRRGLREHFAAARARRTFPADDVMAGRAWVAEYVSFIHYVERVHAAASARPQGHYPEPGRAHEAH